MEAEWLAALPRLREQLGERNFATWIEPIRCTRDEDGLRLEVDGRFFQEWVTRHFLPVIREVLATSGEPALGVRVVVEPRAHGARTRTERPRVRAVPTAPRSPKIGRLVEDYTFDTFVVGPPNEVAARVAHAVAEEPGRQFNPLFLWGGVGLGKTHLVNALAHDLLRRPPRRRIAVLSAESFMNSLIAALKQDHMDAFRGRFRDLDALILDDVQFLAGKERTQEEFFHTFNALHGAGKQVVLTSDKPPHAITGLEQRLRSRFEGGLIADIHPPTFEMRVAIVRQKAQRQGVDLPAAVAELIAQRAGPTVRELEGALNRAVAVAALRGRVLDVPSVGEILAPLGQAGLPPSLDLVLEIVGGHFGVPVSDLLSHSRGRLVAFPRQVAMYLARTLVGASFSGIGEKFGGRDHSSVMYAVRVVEERCGRDADIAGLVRALEHQLRGAAPARRSA